MPNLKIIFAGTPDFASHILADLLDRNQHEIVAVYTQPDRQAGRGQNLTASSVKQLILDRNLNIPIEQPNSLKKRNPNYQVYKHQLESYQADLMVVVAYGLILPQEILNIPKYGCINIHASLLPRWRGAAPIQRAILAGDSTTGISIQQMDAGLDTGDIISEVKCPITNSDTSVTLFSKLETLTYPLLTQTLNNIAESNITPIKQDPDLATYAHKIDKADGTLNFNHSVDYIDRQIRAFTPWPGTQFATNFANTELNIKIIEASVENLNCQDNPPAMVVSANRKGIIIQCGRGRLNVAKLQFSGGKPITAQDALNGKYKDLFKINSLLQATSI